MAEFSNPGEVNESELFKKVQEHLKVLLQENPKGTQRMEDAIQVMSRINQRLAQIDIELQQLHEAGGNLGFDLAGLETIRRGIEIFRTEKIALCNLMRANLATMGLFAAAIEQDGFL